MLRKHNCWLCQTLLHASYGRYIGGEAPCPVKGICGPPYKVNYRGGRGGCNCWRCIQFSYRAPELTINNKP